MDEETADDGQRASGDAAGPDLTKPQPFTPPGPVVPADEAAPAAPYPVPPPADDGRPSSNAMALIALIMSLLIFVPVVAAAVAIVLGILVLTQRRPGRGIAITAIVVGSLALLVQFVVLASLVADLDDTSEADGGDRRPRGAPRWW